MSKLTNSQTFTFIDENGTAYTVVCYTTRTNYRVTEHAECDGYHGKDHWQNRPWYRFTYENALLDLAHKMAGKNEKRLHCFTLCINAKAQSEKDAFEAWFNAFKKDYDNLSDKTKKHLANACPHITSMQQAQDIMQVSKAFDVLFRLEEKRG
jgi:hypothetical protein